MTERKIVIPGETIIEGVDYLPGKNTEKKENEIIALKYGLAEVSDNLVKVIEISGKYFPRRNNVVIGEVEMVTFNGWVISIGSSERAFLPVVEVPRYVHKDGLDEIMTIGDMVVVKIWNVGKRGIDLSLKSRGLGRISEGVIVNVNPHKVPRIIGKEGSMVKIIKNGTGCNITVGQNGLIWVKGHSIEKELLAKEAISFIEANTHVEGLTDKLENFFKEKGVELTNDISEEKNEDENIREGPMEDQE